MGWKKWPGWLKGGIILSGVSLVISLFYIFSGFDSSLDQIILFLPGFIIYFYASENSSYLALAPMIIALVINGLIWFFVGAVIGKKNWPYWLKGAIILSCISALIILSFFIY